MPTVIPHTSTDCVIHCVKKSWWAEWFVSHEMCNLFCYGYVVEYAMVYVNLISVNEFPPHPPTGLWEVPPTTGQGPPPGSAFTFTRVDLVRAVFFGGGNAETRRRVADVFLLNLEIWVSIVWSWWTSCADWSGYTCTYHIHFNTALNMAACTTRNTKMTDRSVPGLTSQWLDTIYLTQYGFPMLISK